MAIVSQYNYRIDSIERISKHNHVRDATLLENTLLESTLSKNSLPENTLSEFTLLGYLLSEHELLERKQARKCSKDTQVAGYAWFEKVWAG